MAGLCSAAPSNACASLARRRTHRSKFVVLPHNKVARSCPILKYGAVKPPASERGEVKKWKIWQHLLRSAYALHCFPPHSMPCPGLKHGEKGCDKSVIMGSKIHIHGEVVFDQQQVATAVYDRLSGRAIRPHSLVAIVTCALSIHPFSSSRSPWSAHRGSGS